MQAMNFCFKSYRHSQPVRRSRGGSSRCYMHQPRAPEICEANQPYSSMTQHNRSLVTGLTFVATLGGLLFGYDTAVISGAVTAIDANFIEPVNLSETARSSLSGWTVSRALHGCMSGAVIAGW